MHQKIIFELFLSFLYRNLSEFLEVLHKLEGGLTCAGACSLVSLLYLSSGICLEISDFGIDFFNEFFHFFSF